MNPNGETIKIVMLISFAVPTSKGLLHGNTLLDGAVTADRLPALREAIGKQIRFSNPTIEVQDEAITILNIMGIPARMPERSNIIRPRL